MLFCAHFGADEGGPHRRIILWIFEGFHFTKQHCHPDMEPDPDGNFTVCVALVDIGWVQNISFFVIKSDH